jgi:hypothetical protein
MLERAVAPEKETAERLHKMKILLQRIQEMMLTYGVVVTLGISSLMLIQGPALAETDCQCNSIDSAKERATCFKNCSSFKLSPNNKVGKVSKKKPKA